MRLCGRQHTTSPYAMPLRPYAVRDYVGHFAEDDEEHAKMRRILHSQASSDDCRYSFNGGCRVLALVVVMLGSADKTVQRFSAASRYWDHCQYKVLVFHVNLFRHNQEFWLAQRRALLAEMSSDSE